MREKKRWARPGLISWSVIILLIVTGCKDTTIAMKDTSGLEFSQISKHQLDKWPEPSSRINGIPVYEKFDDLEGIFHFKNDTTYVINFWATWCKPCIEELPYIEAFRLKNKDKKIKVILCSLDFPNQLENKLLPFIRKEKLAATVIVLLDGKYNDWIDKVSPEWSGAIPATYIYNNDKNYFAGAPFQNVGELEEIVKPFL